MAQLGARFHGMEEVVGSIPTRSTKYLKQLRGGERGGLGARDDSKLISWEIEFPGAHRGRVRV